MESVLRSRQCKYCNGTGWFSFVGDDGQHQFEPCDYCGGTGLSNVG